jgi:hypothetical protein
MRAAGSAADRVEGNPRRRRYIPLPGAARASVITGAFTAKGAVEWAVLCSVRDTSQILILNARNGAVVDSLNRSGDSGWIQGNGNYGAFLPKPIDHDGIDEAFLDKASTTFYFAQGHWFNVGSSD